MPPLRLRAIAARRGQEFVFSGPRVRIGRSRDNDFILPEHKTPVSSGHHAEAVLDSSGVWWIIDLNSSNGTRLNGDVVQRHELQSGDRITFGDEQFTVTLGGRSLVAMAVFTALTAVVGLAVAVLVQQGSARSSFEAAAASADRSVFMIAVDENGARSLVGTAFAVDASGTLATNAHIAAELQRRLSENGPNGAARVVAVRSDTSDARLVTSTSIHPDWQQGSIRADVALLRLQDGEPLTPLPLADTRMTASLRRGAPLAALGFPAVSTDPRHPRGRLSVDVVGDVRDDYIQAGLGITPGMSGSPVFVQTGTVIAIVAGGDFVGALEGVRPSGSAANWAISVRFLRELLAGTH